MPRPRRPEVIACASAAQARGLALLHPPTKLHKWLPVHAGGKVADDERVHRSRPIAPAVGGLESVPDMLAHVSTCLPRLEALIVWESALNRELISPRQLQRIAWRTPRDRRLAEDASPLSDSLLETLALHRLQQLGLGLAQQVRLRGRPVDFLIEERLVVQVDGYQFHSAGQRRADIEHDALLGLDGYPVLRFGYGDVVDRWPHVQQLVIDHLSLPTSR